MKKKERKKREEKERRARGRGRRKKEIMSFSRLIGILFALIGVAIVLQMPPRTNIPPQLLGHPLVFRENLISEASSAQLRKIIHELREFPTLAADLKYYKTRLEHIGEAEPIGEDGKCAHKLLVPNSDRTECVLAGRIDVARHFVKYGGVAGLKESYDTLLTRTHSFGAYLYNISEYPAIRDLFAETHFLAAAKAICPADKQYLDPFQANFILGAPGQTVPLHLDAPYFWGASRFELPQWLLAMMVSSGMWQEQYIDQVQIVAYLHDWNDERGGNFIYWDDPTQRMKFVPPKPRSGSAVDGAKTVHAGDVYMADHVPPVLDKSVPHALRFEESNNTWSLVSNGRHRHSYREDEIRLAIVYRARCFRSAEEFERFRNQPESSLMQLDDILQRFALDLERRGRVRSAQEARALAPLDLALLILDEYIPYPLPTTALIPFNYCAIVINYPWLAPYVRTFLNCK